jgi:uncharacterized membrane protein YfcA
VPIGVALLRYVDPTTFKACIGVLLAIYCPAMLFARNLPHIALRDGRLADTLIGVVGGLMGGVGGLPGPAVTL